jgi:hypothetical protein
MVCWFKYPRALPWAIMYSPFQGLMIYCTKAPKGRKNTAQGVVPGIKGDNQIIVGRQTNE